MTSPPRLASDKTKSESQNKVDKLTTGNMHQLTNRSLADLGKSLITLEKSSLRTEVADCSCDGSIY